MTCIRSCKYMSIPNSNTTKNINNQALHEKYSTILYIEKIAIKKRKDVPKYIRL